MNSELLIDTPNKQDDENESDMPSQLAASLLSFVPSPLFVLPQKASKKKAGGRRRKEDQFEFTFFDPLLDFNRQDNEATNGIVKSVTVGKIHELDKPMDRLLASEAHKRTREQMFAYKRLWNSEVLLSEAVFIELGLCQPAWVAIETPDAYSHIAVAYMSAELKDDDIDEDFGAIWLSPMLSRAFDGAKRLAVRPCIE